jgi:PAS domain S-box-containing protein
MRKPHIPPRDIARDFKVSEAFFSTTDGRGVILAGNRVFSRISGYTEVELIGKPHNIIRHPDVPRAVFKLLWDTLATGQPICAYVKNMAKDGAYYWVVALVAPMPGGYLSVRFKPTSTLLPIVESVYREMRAIEIAAEENGQSGDDAMAASTAYLVKALASKGFADYGAFMRALLREELVSREQELARQGLRLFEDLPHPGHDAVAGALFRNCATGRADYATMRQHFTSLDELWRLDQELRSASQKILEQAGDVGTVAFNVAFRASKLGHEGQSVAVIASYLNQSAVQISGLVKDITKRIGVVSERLSRVVFDLAWLRLQFEMAVMYQHEIASELGPDGHGLNAEQLQVRWGMLGHLRDVFESTGRRALLELEGLAREGAGITDHSDNLDRIVMALRVARVSGLVESSRLESDAFRTIFAQVDKQIESTMQELKHLNRISGRLQQLSSEAPRIGADIRAAGDHLEAHHAEMIQLSAQRTPDDTGWTDVDGTSDLHAA